MATTEARLYLEDVAAPSITEDVSPVQKFLLLLGAAIILIGLLWPVLTKIGLGNLPGDIVIEGENSRIYFPIASCILVSLVLSGIFWLFNR
ncbi:MAG: DUF2905 domain-containing protein [Halioglobus sp.]|nr:DUF2905 domain-containing protein [Halioglobus sp.]